ncbi:MAG: MFS transporter permease [Thermodesulfobacteriota bacterium]
MSTDPKPVKIIPKEKAVFRLDKNGNWRSDEVKFRNRKIINYFHSLIKKDRDGFYLEQEHANYIEKVYFPYEDTALFVSRIIESDGLILCLNTGNQIRLDPQQLFIRNDDLYFQSGEDLIKFSENALLALAHHMDEADDQFVVIIDGKKHLIPGTE